MRLGHPFRGVRDDLLRRRERGVLAALRHRHEVHRTTAIDGAGIYRTLGAHMGADRVAATPQQP